ncbi:unnamed protein product [Dovyalis caffra]|uniref:ARM repeat superfamily protein n=1 Tax=Dovyalis caffra TaxID=77055 RepID=A0AAV1R5R4_9ROSI|nr:unnamed protein product [Dovyalis caffra]
MALESKPNPLEEEHRDEDVEEEEEVDHDDDELARNPSAPPDYEFFEITTTVDPSYIISLIRKLIPIDSVTNRDSHGVNGCEDGGRGDGGLDPNQTVEESGNECEKMDIGDDSRGGEDKDTCRELVGEEVWEECGCVLWDLAASRTHAELMVQNLVLEVLMANLMVSQSARVTEICLGIIGNLACHEAPMQHIVSSNGLITTIVDQLFLDDTQCLAEACRLLTLGLQGNECSPWAEAVQSEHILSRIIWIAENTLNPQLLEKIVGLILATLESQQEASCTLVPSLMKLGLPSLLINLLDFEISRLTGERVPERYSVLDVILRAIEALSVLDGHSQDICSNKKLIQLVCGLVKLPDKAEVASSCVTVAVLIANILSDVPDIASEMSQDLQFLQGLLEVFPLASDDVEARSALWSIIARLLVQVRENDMSLSSLHQYVLVLASKSEIIEDDLLNQQLDNSREETKDLISSSSKSNTRSTALGRIVSILNQWTASKACLNGGDVTGEYAADDLNIGRLLDCCRKHIEFTK